MSRRRFRKWLTDNLPDLPDEFVEWEIRNKRQPKTLAQVVQDFEEWQRLKRARRSSS